MTAPALPRTDGIIADMVLGHGKDSVIIQALVALEALPQGVAITDSYGDIWLKTSRSNTIKGWMIDNGHMGEPLEDALYEYDTTLEDLRKELYSPKEPSTFINAFGDTESSFDLVDEHAFGNCDIDALFLGENGNLLEICKQFKDD